MTLLQDTDENIVQEQPHSYTQSQPILQSHPSRQSQEYTDITHFLTN